ncbi:MAG: hypothetical protein ACREJM_07295 [Candidatus Saccharimonadales bacterium]
MPAIGFHQNSNPKSNKITAHVIQPFRDEPPTVILIEASSSRTDGGLGRAPSV